MDRHGRTRRQTAAATAAPAAFLLLLLLLLLGHTGEAAADAVRHATSQRPHWEVGGIDPGLSDACRRGRFNQIADHRRYIAYRGERGGGVTGIARQSWNLRDADRRAEADATYHFADDGMSTCRVYVAKEKKPAGP